MWIERDSERGVQAERARAKEKPGRKKAAEARRLTGQTDGAARHTYLWKVYRAASIICVIKSKMKACAQTKKYKKVFVSVSLGWIG